MKFFNTTGPVNPDEHYFLPGRLNEIEVRLLIEQKKYFVLHAPRQSGKTTAVLEFIKKINSEGKYTALYINVEPAQAMKSNYIEGLTTILKVFQKSIQQQGLKVSAALEFIKEVTNKKLVNGNSLNEFFTLLAQKSAKPLIIFIDEIDSLVGDTLISVLRQLRSGYVDRPKSFPQSVCLFGVRDVRDYRIWSDEQQKEVVGGSSFNIKAKSLRLENFSNDDVRNLYLQHTKETGQKFTNEAIEYAFDQTQGQPWLVNALAYQACFEMITDRKKTITKKLLETAREILIKQQDTHFDVLIDRLKEPRVQAIVDSIIEGSDSLPHSVSDDDLKYVRDLGLVTQNELKISNPIYQEVLPRALTNVQQQGFTQQIIWYQNKDGSLNVQKLLEAFTQFYRENSDAWLKNFDYKESGPHLLMMAFLQRVINGGGKIHREYALGRKRVDLDIVWQKQRIIIELKIKRGKKYLEDGLTQTAEYMDICNATEGHLVVFDRSSKLPWSKKIYRKNKKINGKIITVWGL